MSGDQVRAVRFLSGGYDASQVDDLLRRIAAELDAGRPAGPLIAGATLQPAVPTLARAGINVRSAWPRGYDAEAVDWFLNQLRRREDHFELAGMDADPWRDLPVANHFTRSGPSDPAEPIAALSRQARLKQAREDLKYLARECAKAWRDFGQQPGTQLRWVPAGVARCELRTADQQTVASVPDLSDPQRTALRAGGGTYSWKRVPDSAWPGIAEIIRQSRRDDYGEYVPATDPPPSHKRSAKASSHDANRAEREGLYPLRELLDQAGMPILYTSGEKYWSRAGACITFPEQRWLRFPVRGTTPANAIMTAVDQAGNKVARYRAIGKLRSITLQSKMEITVHPAQPLTSELALALVISAPWLSSYFLAPSEGGG